MAASVSQSEREAVALCRAKVDAARKLWENKRKPRTDRLRLMLSGEKSVWGGMLGGAPGSKTTEAVVAALAAGDAGANLPLLATTLVKAEVTDGRWDVRHSNVGDLPDELVDEAQEFDTKVLDAACAQDEVADSVDDGATVGPMIVFYGIDRAVVEKERLAYGSDGAAKELIEAAKAGSPDAHPQPGMDLQGIAAALRDFLVADGGYAMMSLTAEQVANVQRVAQECDALFEKEQDNPPAGWQGAGEVWCRRLVYGEDVVWDSRTTTRWRDADFVARFLTLTLEEAQGIAAWKASARKALKSREVTAADGWTTVVAPTGMDQSETFTEANKCVRVVEFWDRRKREVHYFLEYGGVYEGFLERDASYPYDEKPGKSRLRYWYPMACATPIVHNRRVPERTFGIPFVEPGERYAVDYCKFLDAAMSACKKAGAIVEIPPDVDEDTVNAIESGEHLVVVQRKGLTGDDKPLIKVHTFGNVPPEYFRGMEINARGFARAVGLTGPELTGVPVAETATQEVEATQGVRTVRSGLIRKIEVLAGDVARDVGALARGFYSEEKVTEIMGEEFTRREPMMKPDPSGAPDPATGEVKMLPAVYPPGHPKAGEPVMIPSVWDIVKSSSFLGDRVEVQFSATAKAEDAIRARSVDNFVAQLGTQTNPLVPGFPRWDVGPIVEREARIRGLGTIKPYVPSADAMKVAQAFAPKPAEPEGGEADGAEDEGERRETPGGGRSDGRKAHGQRGPAGVPGRQSRERKPGDFAHAGSAANRPKA